MCEMTPMRHGDFSGLAQAYSAYRSGYAPTVRAALLGFVKRPPYDLAAADVAAGTGIWTRMLEEAGFRELTAVEPNDDMREVGTMDSAGLQISWRRGTAEATGLKDGSVDLVTIASALHWVDLDQAMGEFQRILRPGGCFATLWNSRLLEANELLLDIEAELERMKPDLKRISSGRGGTISSLIERLWDTPGFSDALFVEGRHVETQTPAKYIGAWTSVNDVRVQLGEAAFWRFIEYARSRLANVEYVDVTYLTRAWLARRT